MPRLVDVAEKECPADFIEKHWLRQRIKRSDLAFRKTAFTRSNQKRAARKTRKSTGYE